MSSPPPQQSKLYFGYGDNEVRMVGSVYVYLIKIPNRVVVGDGITEVDVKVHRVFHDSDGVLIEAEPILPHRQVRDDEVG